MRHQCFGRAAPKLKKKPPEGGLGVRVEMG
jgi:hypothetical protein